MQWKPKQVISSDIIPVIFIWDAEYDDSKTP